MGTMFQVLGGLCGLGSLVCFIIVVVKMFQNDKPGLGIASIVLLFCCGIGGLVAFIIGWMNAAAWNIQNVMMAWTGLWIAGFVLNLLAMAFGATMFQFNVGR